MTPNITPEALELAQVAYSRALAGPGSHVRGLEAAILAALPELLAAQPASSAGGQEPVTRRERDLMLALGAADVSVSGGFDGVPWKIHLPTAAPVAGEAVRRRIGEIENRIAANNASAAWVFTQMRQLIAAAPAPAAVPVERQCVCSDEENATCSSQYRSNCLYGPPTSAQEPAAWVPPSFFEKGLVAGTARRRLPSEKAVQLRGEYIPLYTAPQPAAPQGVDLGQFREAVEYWANQCPATHSLPSVNRIRQKAESLLKTIDSQHQQQQESGA